jgi:hypothetical protein
MSLIFSNLPSTESYFYSKEDLFSQLYIEGNKEYFRLICLESVPEAAGLKSSVGERGTLHFEEVLSV